MFVGVIKDEMMCRIDPARYEDSLEKPGCHEMLFLFSALFKNVLWAA